jgi:hypothetical protein
LELLCAFQGVVASLFPPFTLLLALEFFAELILNTPLEFYFGLIMSD